MWFKNARLFQLNEDIGLDPQALNEALQKEALTACKPQELLSKGWVSPFGRTSDVYVWQSGEALLFCLGMEEKILPAAAINHQLNQRIENIQSETGQKPGRKQQTDMKQQLVLEMVPQAFVKPKQVFAYLDLNLKMLIVDTSSQNAAEELVNHMRHTLGSFKVSAFGPSSSVAQVMTHWVTHAKAEGGFDIDSEIVLETMDESKGLVRGRNIEHLDDQMQQHIDNGYLVTSLGLVFNDRIDLILGHDLSIKKIKFTDIVLDQMEENGLEDEFQILDTKFTLFSLEIRAMLKALFGVFKQSE